jgi:hypothetical protein
MIVIGGARVFIPPLSAQGVAHGPGLPYDCSLDVTAVRGHDT